MDVFISYSRRDREFVSELHARLTAAGKEVWVDWEDIPLTAKWLEEVKAGIEASDAFVFVISPDSVASEICRNEAEHAGLLNKRIIPVLRRDVDVDALPEQVSIHNWIPFQDGADQAEAFRLLIQAIETDLEWVQAHTRWLVRAREWEREGRDKSFVLRGSELEAAEEWLAAAADKQPEPTPLHYEYLLAGRKAANRRQRITVGAITVALVAMAVLTAAALLQRQEALAQREEATSRALAAQALAAGETGLDTALLLGLEAYRKKPTTDARSSLVSTVHRSAHVKQFLWGHPDDVNAVALTPDGKMLASAGDGGEVILWNVESREPIAELSNAESGGIESLAFSSDGQRLAAGGEKLVLWDVAGRRPLGEPLTDEPINDVAFSRDGTLLAAGLWDGTVRLWDPRNGQRVGDPLGGRIPPNIHDRIEAVAFSVDGRLVAAGDGHSAVVLWDLPSRAPLRVLRHPEGLTVKSVAFSPDGRILASASFSGTIVLWSVESGRPVGAPLSGHTESVNSVAFSHDSRTLVSGSDDATINLWDVATRRRLGAPLASRGASISSLAFSPDGTTFASGGVDGTVMLWDARERPLVRKLTDRLTRASTTGIAFSPDGKTVATAGSVGVWPLAGRPLPHPERGDSVAFSPDGRTVAWGSFVGSFSPSEIVLWDVRTGRASGAPIRIAGEPAGVDGIAFSPDGRTLAAGTSDGRVSLWDVAGRRLLGELPGQPDGLVTSVAFSRDGSILAAAADADEPIVFWDVAKRRKLGAALGGHDTPPTGLDPRVNAIAFSPDGRTLASAGEDEVVILWDVATRRPLGAPLVGHSDAVSSVAFSAAGETLASAGEDGAIIFWDVETRRPQGFPVGHSDPRSTLPAASTFIAFAPDGSTLASASSGETTILLWDGVLWAADFERVRSRLCAIVGRNLTRAEFREFLPDDSYRKTCSQWPVGGESEDREDRLASGGS